ncbi:MAG: HAD family phosphatase [Ignavibacteriaceae bacterium]|nr:HAD family phosphatase [Ignavibacteriaceae bacterium]
MRKYSAVVFDLGMVLVPFDYKIMVNKLEQIQAGLGDHFIESYKSNYHIHRGFERGEISTEDFISQMLKVLNYKIDAETFCKFYSEIFTVNQKVVDLLPILKNNYRLFLLSNTNALHHQYGWKDFPFIHHFEKLILSHEVGAVKPEEKIFRAVEAASGFQSKEHIFIDDISEYIEAAKKLGWGGIQFKGYDDLVLNFKQRGVLN